MDVLKGILGIVLFSAFIILLMMFVSWITGVNIGSKYSKGASYSPDDLPNAIRFLSRKGKEIIQNLSPNAKQKVIESIGDKAEGKIQRLGKLAKLRNSGVITEEEFNILKDEVIQTK